MNMTRNFRRLFAPCPTKNPWIWEFTVLLLALAVSVLAADVYCNSMTLMARWGTRIRNGLLRIHQFRESDRYHRGRPRTASGCDRGITQRQAAIPGRIRGTAIVKAPPYDPQHFVRVEETVTLTLRNLEPHTAASVAFDLYVLKRWDGKNPTMGPTDRASVSVQGGRTLLDTTFSTVRKPALTI